MTISRLHFNITLRDIDPASFNASDFNNKNFSLPNNLLDTLSRDTVRLANTNFDNPGLFIQRDPVLVASGVTSFTVFNATVQNLTNPVNITVSQTEVNTHTHTHKIMYHYCNFLAHMHYVFTGSRCE